MALTITTLPAAPQRTDTPTNFSTKADAWVDALATFVTEANALAAEAETHATEAETAATNAQTAETNAETAQAECEDQVVLAEAAANFGGLYSAMTGAKTVPLSCYHLNEFWALNANTADVTTDVPGTSAKWTQIYTYDSAMKKRFLL